MAFAWSRTWYAEYQGQVYNFEKKSQRDECVRVHGFRKVLAKEAYQYFDIPKIPWRSYERWIRLIMAESEAD